MATKTKKQIEQGLIILGFMVAILLWLGIIGII